MESELLQKLTECVELGKINKVSPFPPQMKGQDGADELTKQALESGISAEQVLESLVKGMSIIGDKFSAGKAYVPNMLMAAKAMSSGMAHLKPFFNSGEVKRKGTFVIGTVFGDLHDIGKNLVAMTVEGAGWEVVDLGVDVKPDKFLSAIEKNPGCVIGLSALLTTTMGNMEMIVKEIKSKFPAQEILVGGAPLSQAFSDKIGASGYSPSPQGAVALLNRMVE
ncbi:MAG: cobalamin-dependent protein [Bacteroidota bacterium]|nr:cobalamin-dependent protein [Bacteroidota bacterium]